MKENDNINISRTNKQSLIDFGNGVTDKKAPEPSFT